MDNYNNKFLIYNKVRVHAPILIGYDVMGMVIDNFILYFKLLKKIRVSYVVKRKY